MYEAVSGARMHAAYFRPGGVYRDLPDSMPQHKVSKVKNAKALAFLTLLTLCWGMLSGRSRYTPPGRKYAACIRAPETASYMSNRSSRSRKQ